MTLINFSKRKSIAILLSFLLTFFVSRMVVYLIDNNIGSPFLGPNLIGNLHIHHYTYGIIILVVIAFVALFIPDRLHKTWLYFIFGIGLGLITDEFGIWLKLNPYYNDIISYFAVIVVSLLLIISALIEHEYRKIKGLNDSNILHKKNFKKIFPKKSRKRKLSHY